MKLLPVPEVFIEMKIYLKLLAINFLIILSACNKSEIDTIDESVPILNEVDSNPHNGQAFFDLPRDSAPQFMNACYIDLDKISNISRFRSAAGHDYSDDFEFCRSMKHYFIPKNGMADSIAIFSPINGKVQHLIQEWAGNQVHIESDDYPAFTVMLFHVNTLSFVHENMQLQAGQLIGYHVGDATWSDIGIRANSSTDGPKSDSLLQSGMRYFSIFELMNDSIFDLFVQKGVSSRSDMIISEHERNNSTLDCNGSYFMDSGTLSNWFTLQ
jgi:hypothetical protein